VPASRLSRLFVLIRKQHGGALAPRDQKVPDPRCEALGGGKPVVVARFDIVLRHAVRELITRAEVKLAIGIAACSRTFIMWKEVDVGGVGASKA